MTSTKWALPTLIVLMGFQACNSAIESYGADKLRGEAGDKLTSFYDEGSERYTLSSSSGSLVADVIRVVNNAKSKQIELLVKLSNTSTDSLLIDKGAVQLDYDGEMIELHLSFGAKDIFVAPRDIEEVRLYFNVEEEPKSGVFNINLPVQPWGQSLAIKAKVPG